MREAGHAKHHALGVGLSSTVGKSRKYGAREVGHAKISCTGCWFCVTTWLATVRGRRVTPRSTHLYALGLMYKLASPSHLAWYSIQVTEHGAREAGATLSIHVLVRMVGLHTTVV